MIKRLIIFIAAVIAIAFIANYYGVNEIPPYKGKPKILETRDAFLYKSKKIIDSDLK